MILIEASLSFFLFSFPSFFFLLGVLKNGFRVEVSLSVFLFFFFFSFQGTVILKKLKENCVLPYHTDKNNFLKIAFWLFTIHLQIKNFIFNYIFDGVFICIDIRMFLILGCYSVKCIRVIICYDFRVI